MTPAMIALILKGIDLAALAAMGIMEAREQVAEIRAFNQMLADEERDATPEEVQAIVDRTGDLVDRGKRALEILEAGAPE